MCILISLIVHELVQKYGEGTVTVKKCDSCTYEKEIHSSGVHESEGGSLKIYSEEDEFSCPKCNKGEPNGKY